MHSIVSFQIIVFLSVLVCIDGAKVGKNREKTKEFTTFLVIPRHLDEERAKETGTLPRGSKGFAPG
jgi:hypothetical protein